MEFSGELGRIVSSITLIAFERVSDTHSGHARSATAQKIACLAFFPRPFPVDRASGDAVVDCGGQLPQDAPAFLVRLAPADRKQHFCRLAAGAFGFFRCVETSRDRRDQENGREEIVRW
jgi:hypothetical protein